MHIVGACQELANEGTTETKKASAYFTMSRMASGKATAARLEGAQFPVVHTWHGHDGARRLGGHVGVRRTPTAAAIDAVRTAQARIRPPCPEAPAAGPAAVFAHGDRQ